jgi:hypothetical protein
MVIPSNDLCLGNDSPTAFQLFDASGNLLLNTISQNAGQIWDAGSETADPANAAFVVGGVNGKRKLADAVAPGVSAPPTEPKTALGSAAENAGNQALPLPPSATEIIGAVAVCLILNASNVPLPNPSRSGAKLTLLAGAKLRIVTVDYRRRSVLSHSHEYDHCRIVSRIAKVAPVCDACSPRMRPSHPSPTAPRRGFLRFAIYS